MPFKKYLLPISLSLIAVLVLTIGARYFFVFAEGTKAGHLNTFQKKGYVFKTYEGILIQNGFKANLQGNEFEFSVSNPRIAKTLMENAGKEMELHYVRYFGTLPWRGNTNYTVDSIYYIKDQVVPAPLPRSN